MNKQIICLLKILSIFITCTTSSNILGLFPHPGYSHFKVFYPILKGLAEKEHNITVVTYIKSKNYVKNYYEIIIYGEDTIHLFEFKNFIPSRSFTAMFTEYFALETEGKRACKAFYESGAVEEILLKHKENPYDLVITENFNTDCYLGVPYLLNVPIIGLSSCALMPWHYDRIALPDTPSFIPSEFVGFSERMSITERLTNFIVTKGVALLYRLRTEISDNEIIRENLHIDINVREIARKTSLILVNQHYSLSGPRPLPSRVIEIGGIHIQDHIKDMISKDCMNFLNNSKNGVIFISWGSMLKASTLTTQKVTQIVNALEKLPENIIWKWENEKLPTNNEKFMFVKWAPQKELLCHPKVKIFWSHGGLLGVSESVYCGKPCVITPVYGDQFLNGRAIENRNMGIILTYDNLLEENIVQTFMEISKPKYVENANYVSNVYRNRQNTPLETALWWIEHVLDTKGSNLSYSPAVELNPFVYYSLDVISLLILSTLFAFAIPFYLILIFCCRKRKIVIKKRKIK